jgi:hypothetical protein
LRRGEAGLVAAGLSCLAAVTAVVVAAHKAGSAVGSPITPPGDWRYVVIAGVVVAVVAYAASCWLSLRTASSRSTLAAIAVAVQGVPLAGPLLLSTDASSYATYGRAHQPYVLQDGWATPSVYGPLWTFLSEPIARLSRPELGFRALAAASVLGIAFGAAALTASAAAFVIVGWNPLFALHAGGGGHNDAVMIALVVLALVLEKRGHSELAGVAWAASIWIKWVSVFFWAAWLVTRFRERKSLGLAGFLGLSGVLVIAAFARFGRDWLRLFQTASNEARRESSIGLLGWLGDVGVPHREALAVAALASLVVIAALLYEAWRHRLRLGLGAGFLALAQARLNPWYGFWSVGLAGADGEKASLVVAVALTALLLLVDVPPW